MLVLGVVRPLPPVYNSSPHPEQATMAKVLLINPSYEPTYGGTKGGVTNPIFPTLGLATIAAVARQRGHQVEILDLSWRSYDWSLIQDRVRDAKPDVVGVTATTPLMNQLRDISVLVKDISKDIAVVGGGPHPTALPIETLNESLLDAVFVGEADFSFGDYLDAGRPDGVAGLVYRSGDEVINTGARPLLEDLDQLPMPAWDLYDPMDYCHTSRLLARRLPVGIAEFSRGCVFKCDFCASKSVLGLGYRKKSPERCAEEASMLQTLGFREFWLADDIFTSDQKWAVGVCEAIARRNLDIIWTCTNGIRVESADDTLFNALKGAGCYRVSFGFESGNDQILQAFGKGGRATIDQGRAAVEMARKAGLDTAGTLLLGISHDTEQTMMDTIEYGRTLPLDMMKFGVTIAFPGTPMFKDYVAKGLVRSYDWDKYFAYTDEALFAHENLTYETIAKYMEVAYKRAILYNPGFAWRRLVRGFRTGEFFWDVYYAVRFFLAPASRSALSSAYYGQERWPRHDYALSPPGWTEPQVVRKARRVA